jgi:hypothetical protein
MRLNLWNYPDFHTQAFYRGSDMLRILLSLGLIMMAGAMSPALAQLRPDNNLLSAEINKGWKTLATPNFNIHHEAANTEYAQHLATVAERVHAKLSGWLGWIPKEPTEVVLLDTIDISNGYATPFAYNRITIYLTSPVEGELVDQTPWMELVFTHEYVHILHLDMAESDPLAVRNVFGRLTNLFSIFSFPQPFAPSWVAEGIAVYGESEYGGLQEHTNQYGRLNNAFFDGLMRMEVQRGLYSLTEVSFNSGFRWPYGQVYVYGAYFFKFVEEKYGREAVTDYIKVYGRNLIPFRMDKRSKQIFGLSAARVWKEYQDYLTQRFEPQLLTIQSQQAGLSSTVYDGRYSNTALAPGENGDLYFLHDDTSGRPQVRRIKADGSNEALLDGRGVQTLSWHNTAGLLLNKFAVCDNTNVYTDLYRWQPGMAAAKRLTHCGRYLYSAWRPDGQAIAAIQAERGKSRLMLLDESGKELAILSALPDGDTLGHIAWSPDGATLVATIHRLKIGWTLELLEVKNQQWRVISATNNLLQRPQFTTDGKEVYFLSDHDKVWNVRRLNLAGNTIETLSNTPSIIAEAVLMPDQSLRMVEYTPYGLAIKALPAQTGTMGASYAAIHTPLPTVDAIRNAKDYAPYAASASKDYTPFHTLKAQSWFPLLNRNQDKTSSVGVLLSGSDALNFNTWLATPVYYDALKKLGGFARYNFYNHLSLRAQRQFFTFTNADASTLFLEDERRYQGLLSHTLNTLDSSLYFAGGVASELISLETLSGSGVNRQINNKLVGAITEYDNSRLYKRSVAPVEGRRVELLTESYTLLGSSTYTGSTSRVDWREYIGLGRDHALQLRLLYGQGDAGIRPYRLGGESNLFSVIGGETGLGRRDFPLRGYPLGLTELTGTNLGFLSAEWNFPLAYHYDGWFVPPIGVGRQSLALFVDSGDAWNASEKVKLKTGAGVEWNIEALLGYDRLKLSTTLGWAHGFDNGGDNRLYFRINLPFI